MDTEALFNVTIARVPQPRWKAPLRPALIKIAEKNLADFEISDDMPVMNIPKPIPKPIVKKQATTFTVPDVPSIPTTAKKANAQIQKQKQKAIAFLEDGSNASTETAEEGLEQLVERAKLTDDTDTIGRKPSAYIPSNRKLFKPFIIDAYSPYKLLPLSEIMDPDACAKKANESKSSMKKFQYQQFVRDYIQRASPYRGVLVYHGLGSGKTCSSIAGLEALYQKGQSPIYVFTPASLESNYRGDISKCGPFLFRTNNFWTWLPIVNTKVRSRESDLALKVLKMPASVVKKQKGIWIPDPLKKVGKDFEELTALEKKQIQEQIREHIDSRIQFIHYNGLSIKTLKFWACSQPHRFDGSTIVVDEVHNLSRLINNSNLDVFYKTEPADLAQYIPLYCEKGKKYRIAYLLYRILCNAVGCKIIALSATPIINYPQELGILANVLAGDTRLGEIQIDGVINRDELLKTLLSHPEVDFAEIIPQKGSSILRVTPVPSGCSKIFDETTGVFKGYLRNDYTGSLPQEINRERNLPEWFKKVTDKLVDDGIRIGEPKFRSLKLLPDLANSFRDTFINTVELKVNDSTRNILSERLTGLISYYKGGTADYMAQVTRDDVIEVEMSNSQLEQYTERRQEEIKRERKQKKKDTKKPGVTYDDVVTNQNSTFKIFSRATCNFAFPEGFERPYPSDFFEATKKLTGETVVEEGADTEVEMIDTTEQLDILADTEKEKEKEAAPTTYDIAIATILAKLKSPEMKHLFSKKDLKEMSPKFQAILDNIEKSAGPVLVYSNFKKLEGIGLFAVSLEAQMDFQKLDIIKKADGWHVAPESMNRSIGKPVQRYVLYTGDEVKEKRDILLKIYNGQWAKLPSSLVSQIHSLTGFSTNLHGEIVKAILITQTGAEGISLANVRQVHIMEPYWNYVRLEQVKGRAVRICSHMDLPPNERTVDIFTYIAKFAKHQEIDETLKNNDGGISTDQNILNLLNAKKKLADSIMDVMKSSAVDCELNKTENGSVTCYKLPGKPTMEFAYHPSLEDHLTASAGKIRTVRG